MVRGGGGVDGVRMLGRPELHSAVASDRHHASVAWAATLMDRGPRGCAEAHARATSAVLRPGCLGSPAQDPQNPNTYDQLERHCALGLV